MPESTAAQAVSYTTSWDTSEYLRKNKLAITVFDDYDHILDACCNAWNFFANDNSVIASITSRSWAAVNG